MRASLQPCGEGLGEEFESGVASGGAGFGAGPACALGSVDGVAGVEVGFGTAGSFTFLRGCCASGKTSGPFCPHPVAARRAARSTPWINFMFLIIAPAARGLVGRNLSRCDPVPRGSHSVENPMNRVFGVLLAAATAAVSTAALADNPLGAYVGAGVGASNVGSQSYYDYGYYGGYHDNDVAWKAIFGVRPIPFAGAEAEWIDFGSGNGNNGFYTNGYYYSNSSSHPKAALLYGVGYLPLPVPFLDVYGKAGVARLQTDITTYAFQGAPGSPGGIATQVPTTIAYRTDEWDWKFAWGAGVQYKWQDFAFRAEYERIDSPFGDPSAVTVSATWTF
jgi:hypothetical protein